MIRWAKQVAHRLPAGIRRNLKKLYFASQLRRGSFASKEPEFRRLHEWVRPGDCVLDIGANVGHYTLRLSRLVGSTGRVIAVEPVPESFEQLATNLARRGCRNVSLFNFAASDIARLGNIHVPKSQSGRKNYYRATLTTGDADLTVLCLPMDALLVSVRVSLIKLDVEMHELAALKGMESLLSRDKPRLIVEGESDAVASYLASLGYSFEADTSSPNRVYRHAHADDRPSKPPVA